MDYITYENDLPTIVSEEEVRREYEELLPDVPEFSVWLEDEGFAPPTDKERLLVGYIEEIDIEARTNLEYLDIYKAYKGKDALSDLESMAEDEIRELALFLVAESVLWDLNYEALGKVYADATLSKARFKMPKKRHKRVRPAKKKKRKKK